MSQIWVEVSQRSRIFLRIPLCSGDLHAKYHSLNMTTYDFLSLKIWQTFAHFFQKNPFLPFKNSFCQHLAKIHQQKALCDIVRNCAQQKMNLLNAVEST
jgi:hypothetical protein